jgi:hypothetical protein
MIATINIPLISPEQLMEMPDASHYELVDGRLVERNVSTLSSLVEGFVFAKVDAYVRPNKLGLVWPGTLGFQCFSQPAQESAPPRFVLREGSPHHR